MNYNVTSRSRRPAWAFAVALLGLLSANAHALSYNGRIDLVQSTGANSTSVRYYISAQGLSVFATGVNETILREAFFRKANVSISYQPMDCPNGTLGTCGSLTLITVHALNLP